MCGQPVVTLVGWGQRNDGCCRWRRGPRRWRWALRKAWWPCVCASVVDLRLQFILESKNCQSGSQIARRRCWAEEIWLADVRVRSAVGKNASELLGQARESGQGGMELNNVVPSGARGLLTLWMQCRVEGKAEMLGWMRRRLRGGRCDSCRRLGPYFWRC